MNEILSHMNGDTASQIESICRERLDALVRGEFSEEDFISEFASLAQDVFDSPWNLAEWINTQYHRGQVPADLFRSLESKIAQRGADMVEDGETAELYPISRPKRRAPPEFIEQRTSARAIDCGWVLRDRYVIESRLGAGGMGTVFKALDRFRGDLPNTNRHVAVKILNDEISNRPKVFAKLRREFYCAQSLSHRNIVRVYELDRDGDVAFFTMELLEGEPLSKVIERFRPGTVSRPYAWRVVREVGAALAHAHARDVVHADLKPQNIMITHSGDVRLLDFGTSSVSVRQAAPHDDAHGDPKRGSTALTPAYASCELLEGMPADPRDDLFAFACLTYELLTGKHPFGQYRSTEARSLRVAAVRPSGLSQKQWNTLELGLAWSRADRSMSISAWVAALNADPEIQGVVPSVPSVPPVHPVSGVAAARSVPAAPAVLAAPTAPHVRGRPAALRISPRLMAGVALLVVCLVVWSVHNRSRNEARPHDGGPVVALSSPPIAAPTATPIAALTATSSAAPTASQSAAPAAAPVAAQTLMPNAAPTAAPVAAIAAAAATPIAPPPALTAAAAPRATERDSAPRDQAIPATAPSTGGPSADQRGAKNAQAKRVAVPQISTTSRAYRVRAGGHFAEVHVRRSASSSGDASFDWWTEPSSAYADEDYFSQTRTTQTFAGGHKSASLFVRVIPNAARKAPRVFYVVIGSPSMGTALGQRSRVRIVLLPQK